MQSGETVWDPLNIIECAGDYKFALVILNQPILLHHDYVLPLWEKAQVTLTVDGGTNQWMEYLGDRASAVLSGNCKKYLPMLVTGDMDSISSDLLDRLKKTEANVIYTPDIMETDYTKSLRQLRQYVEKNNIKLNGIHVLAETGGRLDQIISNVNTLYKCDKLFNDTQLVQVASDSLTWLLKTGTHRIIIPDVLLKSKSWCALIPFGDPSNCVTTTGLKWNLNNTCMKFGELLSTSNTYSGQSEVTIITNVPVVWTMGIEPITRVKKTQ